MEQGVPVGVKTEQGDVVVIVSPGESSCLRKLKPGEPSFTLRAQDLTADLAVLFWVRVNNELQKAQTPQGRAAILADIKARLDREFSYGGSVTDPKLLEAMEVSMSMGEWPDRKVAD